jgi:hypothetical protein
MLVDGESTQMLLVFTPVGPLPAGAMVSVTVLGELQSSFVVASTDSVTRPATPTISGVDVEGAYFGGFSCPIASHVTVTVASNEGLVLLTDVGTSDGLPTYVHAIGSGASALAVDLPEGEQVLHVTTVDVAGNMSASTPTPEFSVPTEQSGCAAGARSSSWLCAALIALVLCRRRHHHVDRASE